MEMAHKRRKKDRYNPLNYALEQRISDLLGSKDVEAANLGLTLAFNSGWVWHEIEAKVHIENSYNRELKKIESQEELWGNVDFWKLHQKTNMPLYTMTYDLAQDSNDVNVQGCGNGTFRFSIPYGDGAQDGLEGLPRGPEYVSYSICGGQDDNSQGEVSSGVVE
jgi:hypothetical protein